jgi:hypothetical protein
MALREFGGVVFALAIAPSVSVERILFGQALAA